MGKVKDLCCEDELPDAGLGSGVESDVTDATRRRGFEKVKDTSQLPEFFGMMEGGFAGRPRGWER